MKKEKREEKEIKQKEICSIPIIIYKYLWYQLKKHADREGSISIKEVEWHLFQWRYPESIKHAFIKEMEMLGMIEKVNNRVIKILPNYNLFYEVHIPKISEETSKFDVENLGEIYEKLGLFKDEE